MQDLCGTPAACNPLPPHSMNMQARHGSEPIHRQYVCIALVRAADMTTASLFAMHELMMRETCNSSALIMPGDNLPVCCFSKCRGCITLWEWVPSMCWDGDRLGARLRPALLLPVSTFFWDGERVTIFNSKSWGIGSEEWHLTVPKLWDRDAVTLVS